MTIKLVSDRQYELTAIVPFTLADFGASGVAENAVELPSDAIVTGGDLVIDVAFDSVTTDAIAVGDTDSVARYVAAADAKVVASTAIVPTGIQLGAGKYVTLQWTGVGGGTTTGAGRVILKYIRQSRSNENQG